MWIRLDDASNTYLIDLYMVSMIRWSTSTLVFYDKLDMSVYCTVTYETVERAEQAFIDLCEVLKDVVCV